MPGKVGTGQAAVQVSRRQKHGAEDGRGASADSGGAAATLGKVVAPVAETIRLHVSAVC